MGFFLIKSAFKKAQIKEIRFKRNRYKEFSDFVKEQMLHKEKQNIFKDTGIGINMFQYSIIRYLIFSAALVILLVYEINYSIDLVKYGVLYAVLFLVTSPKMYFLGKKTPFNYAITFLKKEYQGKKDMEVYRAITQLKNLAIAQQDKPLGSDFIIQQLMKFTKVTKPIFSNMLQLWRLGKEEEACKYFGDAIGTRLGKEFASVLIKLDKINPYELKEQLIMYQNAVREEQTTRILSKNEQYSNIIFTSSVACALAILLNFVVIVLYTDQLKTIFHI